MTSSQLSQQRNLIHTLLPGEIYFGIERTMMQTLLGSCVSIVLWHPQKKYLGFSHFLLSRGDGNNQRQGYYGEDVLRFYLSQIQRIGTQPAEYQVKVFGGGNMFDSLSTPKALNVAQNNIAWALKTLRESGFSITARDTGGRHYRRVIVDGDSGNVWLQRGDVQQSAFEGTP
jgi:chemotaxis protein CheD